MNETSFTFNFSNNNFNYKISLRWKYWILIGCNFKMFELNFKFIIKIKFFIFNNKLLLTFVFLKRLPGKLFSNNYWKKRKRKLNYLLNFCSCFSYIFSYLVFTSILFTLLFKKWIKNANTLWLIFNLDSNWLSWKLITKLQNNYLLRIILYSKR